MRGAGARATDALWARAVPLRRASTLGSLRLDRTTPAAAATAVSLAGAERKTTTRMPGKEGEAGTCRFTSTRWFPSPAAALEKSAKLQRRAPSRTPTKTPARDPDELNVWELMEGLDDEAGDGGVVARSPEFKFDTEVLSVFRDAIGSASLSAIAPVSHQLCFLCRPVYTRIPSPAYNR